MTYKLLDTGYISNDTLTNLTQLSRANRAGYDGSSAVKAFEFGALGITRSRNVVIDNKGIINSFDYTKTNLTGVSNPVINFTIQFKRDVSNTGYQYNYLIQLLRLEETKGLKLLYPTILNTSFLSVIELLGARNITTPDFTGNFGSASPDEDDGTILNTYPYLLGRVKFGTLSDGNNTSNLFLPCTFIISD